jgi:hypothetical protein
MKLIVFILLFCMSAWAQEENGISKRQLTIAGAAVTAGVGSGVISYQKYSSADKTRAAATSTVHGSAMGVSSVGEAKTFSDDELKSMQTKFHAADEVEITHYLNDNKNKELHLENKKSEISSHQSDASSYRTQADMALLPTTEIETYIEDGETKTRTVIKGPDWGKHMMYNSMADDSERAAEKATAELATMKTRPPSSFPKIHLTEVIKSSPKSVESALKTMKAFGSDGGKIVKVTRLPESAVKEIAKKKLAGGVAAAASAASMAVALEEVVFGKIANAGQGGSKRLENGSGSYEGYR